MPNRADSRRPGPARRRRQPGGGVEGHHQDRPHLHAGRHAPHARPGMVGLCCGSGRSFRAAAPNAHGGAAVCPGRPCLGAGFDGVSGFAEAAAAAAAEIARITRLSCITAPNRFTVQSAHRALVQLS